MVDTSPVIMAAVMRREFIVQSGESVFAIPSSTSEKQKVEISATNAGVAVAVSIKRDGSTLCQSVTIMPRRSAGFRWRTPVGLIELRYIAMEFGPARFRHLLQININDKPPLVVPPNSLGKYYGNPSSE